MALEGSLDISTEPLNLNADLREVRAKIDEFRAAVASAAGPISLETRAKWDAELVEPLHRALRLTRRTAADMRFWHWLTTVELRDFVLLRWYGSIPASPADANLPDRIYERFLGRFNLHDVSRNALARLWWCGETLRSDAGDYALVRRAFAKQDLYQAVFEREIGLCAPAARACVKVLAGLSEADWRYRMRRLGFYATTISLEVLSETEIEHLLIDKIGGLPAKASPRGTSTAA
jgi:hypothetical protein